MMIENHTYKLHHSGNLIIRDIGTPYEMQIPMVEDNWAYQEFLRWDAVPGNDPDPADPLPPRTLAQRREMKSNIAKQRHVKDTP